MNPNETSLHQVVAEALQASGWTLLTQSTAIALKEYPSLTPKDAHVYMIDYGPSCWQMTLSGEYRSEGRNVLEPHSVLIPKNATAAQVIAAVKSFADNVDAVVNETYGVRVARAQR